MGRRNTIQKELVLTTVRKLKKHVTADEVYENIKKDHPSISRGTVYRNLSLLSEEGEIRKIEVPEGPDYFDFTLKDHYHVKCIKCGKIYDVDIDYLPDLLSKIKDDHGIKFFNYDIFFKGICRSCQQQQEES
jgi:Fur family transcriptional regulator, ferric uptake regulator